jgi:hypothetical protein
LHWLSPHWGDVVPAWLAVIVVGVLGWSSWCSSRRSSAAERKSRDAKHPAHEAQAQLAQDRADATELFPWRIDRTDRQHFRLVNLTHTRKYDVVVTGEPAGRAPGVFRPGGGRGNRLEVIDGRETKELDCSLQCRLWTGRFW